MGLHDSDDVPQEIHHRGCEEGWSMRLEASPVAADRSVALPLEQALSERLSALEWSDLSPALVEAIKVYVLDNIGVMAGAAHAPGIAALNAALTAWENSGGRATALVGGFRASPPTAALANGTAAHALDFDDQHDPARIHVFCTVFPAALAAAETECGISGRHFITALAAGAELSCRLGLTCFNNLGNGWHPTTGLGAIAAAAAAAKIFRLGPAQTLNALAIAFVQLSGTAQSSADGALTKRMGAGLAARAGVLSAQLARYGLTGPHRFLEGKAGLFMLYERGEVARERLIDGFGEQWQTLDISVKPFPCCRAAHTVIQLALDLHQQGLRLTDVETGEIELGHLNWQMVGAPFNPPLDNPVVHAQFNAAYGFSRALRDGKIDLTSFLPEKIMATEIRAAAQKLRCTAAPDIEAGAVAPARVLLGCRDGSTLTRSSNIIKGSPEDPMTRDEVMRKFRSCLAFGLDADRAAADRLATLVFALDTIDDVTSLVSAFTSAHGGRMLDT